MVLQAAPLTHHGQIHLASGAPKVVDQLALGQAYAGVGDTTWHKEGLLADRTISVAARILRSSHNQRRTDGMTFQGMSTKGTTVSLAQVWSTNSTYTCFPLLSSHNAAVQARTDSNHPRIFVVVGLAHLTPSTVRCPR